MINYIAFLRGINVGGKKIIKMDDLTEAFNSLGFANVKTYIQTGNITFSAKTDDILLLTKKIEKKLSQKAGSEIAVMIRTLAEIENFVKLDPFKKSAEETKKYITFLHTSPAKHPELPLVSGKKDIEVFRVINNDVFSLGFPYKDRFGFPNNFIEKEFGTAATTRNWNTILKILK
ncbi:DUF1697 domain-containing protein [Bacteroidota bacterium]